MKDSKTDVEKDVAEFVDYLYDLRRLRDLKPKMTRHRHHTCGETTCNFLMYVDDNLDVKFSIVGENNQRLNVEDLPLKTLVDYARFRKDYQELISNAGRKKQ